jgi:hypothetical protein
MPEMVSLLLEVGASPHDMDTEQNTPLHIAAAVRPMPNDLFTTLLKHGAHLDAKNVRGETPLNILQKFGIDSEPSCPVFPLQYMSLQCLCAQAIVSNQVPYQGLLPGKLEEFVQIH